MKSEKSDRRVKYTKAVLRQSLLELMKDRPVNKITVTEICTLADINRGTFYSHYADPYDLLQQIENELYEDIIHLVRPGNDETPLSDVLYEIFSAIAQHRDLGMVLFSQHGDKEFLARVLDIAYERSVADWTRIDPDMDPELLEWLYTYIVSGAVGIIRKWTTSGMPVSPRELAEFVCRVSKADLDAFNLGRSNGDNEAPFAFRVDFGHKKW